MSNFILDNGVLKVTVAAAGAELMSVYDLEKDQELLWNGDKKYWGRRAPVLFPFVGSVKNKRYIYDGKEYPMGQHGFARDMVFECVSQSEDSLWFRLNSDEATKEKYPFDFVLDIGYELNGRDLKVLWKVENPADSTMYFSIGAHPGFLCPLKDGEKQQDYYLDFHTDKDCIKYHLIKQEGLLGIYNEELPLCDGKAEIAENMFDRDALVVENRQSQCVSLLNAQKEPYVTVTFDAPLFGVWSPTGLHAPFVCIEPWYGRCDKYDFEGTLEEREYGQTLSAHEVFEKEYVITIH